MGISFDSLINMQKSKTYSSTRGWGLGKKTNKNHNAEVETNRNHTPEEALSVRYAPQ